VSPLAGLVPDMTPVLPTVLFLALSALCIVSAVFAAVARRIVHAAFGLMAAFFGVAGLYALLGSDFLALVQIVVYVGGILILLVFGVLLTGRAKGQLGLERPPRLWLPALAGGLLLAGLLACLFGTDFASSSTLSTLPEPKGSTVGSLGRALLDPNQYLFPFELVSVLLLVALVGAAFLVRRKRSAPS
jgi:NADH-quinone oxidoreductase subunit J